MMSIELQFFLLSQIGADDDIVMMLKKHVVVEYQRQKVSLSLSLLILFLFVLSG